MKPIFTNRKRMLLIIVTLTIYVLIQINTSVDQRYNKEQSIIVDVNRIGTLILIIWYLIALSFIEMAEVSDALIAFWDDKSCGTKSMIEIARRKGLQVAVVRYDL